MSISLKQQNWQHFTLHHLRDWYGIWTRYSPSGNVTNSFTSQRSFESNPQKTEIVQTNHYIYADGTTEKRSWEYNEVSNSRWDGLFHPESESMRGFFFGSGHAAWATTKLELGSYFAVELFFICNELRHSVGVVYDKLGSLLRIANIREDARGFPSQYWSDELNQLPQRNFTGNWQGTSVVMTRDLKISAPIPTELKFPLGSNKTFFLPDGVSVSCPDQVDVGSCFTIAANWRLELETMQQLLIYYDESGSFCTLTLEHTN
jgi:hypothetical protein